MQAPNRGSLNQSDLMSADVAVVTGTYQRIGSYTMPAGLYKSIGFGTSSSYADAAGRMFAKVMDNTASPGAEVTGKFRISIFSPQDRAMYTVGEWPTSALDSNQTDRTKWVPSPKSQYNIGKDYKFVVEFKPDRACTVSATNSIIQIDTTEQLIN